jgi:hypothetical protein
VRTESNSSSGKASNSCHSSSAGRERSEQSRSHRSRLPRALDERRICPQLAGDQPANPTSRIREDLMRKWLIFNGGI